MNPAEDIFDSLTDEQKARARSLRTPEEVLAFARNEGYELTDEQLEAVSGGSWGQCEEIACPQDDGAPECDRYC